MASLLILTQLGGSMSYLEDLSDSTSVVNNRPNIIRGFEYDSQYGNAISSAVVGTANFKSDTLEMTTEQWTNSLTFTPVEGGTMTNITVTNESKYLFMYSSLIYHEPDPGSGPAPGMQAALFIDGTAQRPYLIQSSNEADLSPVQLSSFKTVTLYPGTHTAIMKYRSDSPYAYAYVDQMIVTWIKLGG